MYDEVHEALKRLQGYAESSVLFQLMKSGVLDLLAEPVSIEQILKSTGWNREVLQAYVEFMVDSGLAKSQDDEVFVLTVAGKNCLLARGWYELLIGGYASTISHTDQLLLQGPSTYSRDFRWVSIGSGNIGKFDAMPIVMKLMKSLEKAPNKIVDLGCGDAQSLITYSTGFPNAKVIGCDASKEVVSEARQRISEEGLRHRVSVTHCRAENIVFSGEEDVVVLAFVLHEITGQRSKSSTIEFLKRVRSESPTSALIIIEVDPNMGVEERESISAAGYYNLYFLVQKLTQQQLLSRHEWIELISSAGYSIVHTSRASPDVDSTNCLFGVLCKPSSL